MAEPLRLFDCCPNTDGGGACIVTSIERARDLRKHPARILGAGQSHSSEIIHPHGYGQERWWNSRARKGRIALMEPSIAKFRTHLEADEATREYYRRLSPADRLEILFELRAFAHKEKDAASERMVPVYRIAELKRG